MGIYVTHEMDAPAWTITATHRNNKRLRTDDGRSRYFTTRELARLQGFDDAWEFRGDDDEQMRQIGNAVPPPMARALMAAIAAVLS